MSTVVVRVGPDHVVGRSPEHHEEVAAAAVAVEVGPRPAVAARGCRTRWSRRAGPRACARACTCRRGDMPVYVRPNAVNVPPTTVTLLVNARQRRVAVGRRMRVRDPVDDLPLTRAGRVQARVVEVDAQVEDADGDSAAVPGRMPVEELRSARVPDRHVRVAARRAGAGWWLRRRFDRAVWPRIGQRQDLVDVDRLDSLHARGLVGLSQRDADSDVAEPVVAIENLAAERPQVTGDRARPVARRGDEQRDGSRALPRLLGEQHAVVLGELALRALRRRCRTGADDDDGRHDQRSQTREETSSRA